MSMAGGREVEGSVEVAEVIELIDNDKNDESQVNDMQIESTRLDKRCRATTTTQFS
jgi:hypothetical protein